MVQEIENTKRGKTFALWQSIPVSIKRRLLDILLALAVLSAIRHTNLMTIIAAPIMNSFNESLKHMATNPPITPSAPSLPQSASAKP